MCSKESTCHVRVTSDRCAQIGVRRTLPLIFKCLTLNVGQAHGRHAASDNVKASRDDDDVEVVMGTIFEIDARLVKAGDGVLLDINDVDIGSVELFEVGILEARSFDAPIVRHVKRCEDVLLLGVVNASSLFLGPEVVGRLVGLLVEEVVSVVT